MRGNGEHVLIVEDEEQLRDMATEMLIALGYSAVVVARRGGGFLPSAESGPSDHA